MSEAATMLKCPLCGASSYHVPRIADDLLADMRRKFGRKLRKAGFSYRQICKIVGWKSPRTAMLQCK